MSKIKKVIGALGNIDGTVSLGEVIIRFTSDNKGETISFLFVDKCQFTVSFKEIEKIINSVNAKVNSNVLMESEFYEEEALTTGIYMAGRGVPIPKTGEIHLNFRKNSKNTMLSVAFKDKGEISINYVLIEDWIDNAMTRQG